MHFSVYVACAPNESYEDLLENYDESSGKEKVFNRSKADMIKEGREYQDRIKAQLKENPDMELSPIMGDYLSAKTDDDLYLLEKDDDGYEYDEYGDEYCLVNPDAKWDWYELGGRFQGSIFTKDGRRVNFAEKKDIKWELSDEDLKDSSDFWDKYVENHNSLSKEDKEKYWSLMKPEYFKDKYRNKKTYLESCRMHAPFAFLSAETGWLEKGEICMFGSSETDEEGLDWELNFGKIIEKIPDNYTIYCVDCHI